MRWTIVLAVSLLFGCCKPVVQHETVYVHDTIPGKDSIVYVPQIDSIPYPVHDTVYLVESAGLKYDALKRSYDSLAHRDFLKGYKIERVRHYLNITLRNPAQKQFLQVWIKRAIE